jgi:aldehyde dehydrogenase (NAD(P)+)
VPFYAGAAQRQERFCAATEGQVERLGSGDGLAWALATGLTPQHPDRTPFREESWCPFTAEVALDSQGSIEFLVEAVRFANDELYGNLACGILLDGASQRDPALQRFLAPAIRDLRYGTVAINHWPAVGFALGVTPWGAYPENDLANARSGIGFVHGTAQFAAPQKSVVRGPFVPKIALPWVLGHKRPLDVARALAGFEAAPNPGTLMRLGWAAARG